jgi:hypothetical protein
LRKAVIIFSANSNMAKRSLEESSLNVFTQRRGAMSVCPGVMGMFVGKAQAKSLPIISRALMLGFSQ